MSEETTTYSSPFRVICIDTEDKPWNIDIEQWPEENTEYIVTGLFKDIVSGETSFVLLDMDPEPYKGYKANRFAISNSFSVN